MPQSAAFKPTVTIGYDLSDPARAEEFRLAANAAPLMAFLVSQYQRFKQSSGGASRVELTQSPMDELKKHSLLWILEPSDDAWPRPRQLVELTLDIHGFESLSRAHQIRKCLCGLKKYLDDDTMSVSWYSCAALVLKNLEEGQTSEWFESHAEDMRWAGTSQPD